MIKKYQKFRFCCCVIESKKAFKEEEDICKLCLKLLEIQDIPDAINPKIYVLWKDNQEYRVCTNLYCCFAGMIFRKENIKGKWGKISQETLSIYLNSSTYQGEPLGHITICCPIESLYVKQCNNFCLVVMLLTP